MPFVLTNRAMFQCKHMPSGVPMSAGITISKLVTHLNINGALPIAAGAVIGGFTSALCPFVNGSGVAQPCVSFTLTIPTETKLSVDGSTVFTSADAAAIAAIPSKGNLIPGLMITEAEVLVSAV
jgi:hypothetical protein